MAYRFKLSESFEHGVRRIGVQQIDRAIADLSAHASADEAVHATRKALKRIRALLRLARPGLAREIYQEENRTFRDIGRLLARSRDRRVVQQTIETLEALAEGKTKLALGKVHEQCTAQNGGDAGTIDKGAVKKALAALKKARKRFEVLPLREKGYGAAFEGLKRGYAKAVATLEQAVDSGETEDIHEWRKRVQHHWRQMCLLSEAWPQEFAARIDEARALATALGEDHDIALVLHAIGAEGPLKPTPAQRRAIEAFATARQEHLRREALKTGQALFAQTPRQFHAQVEDYWRSARRRAAKPKARAKVKAKSPA